MNDWRLQGQEKYLQGVVLQRRSYRKYSATWEHDHCEFCGAKFSEREGGLHVGYVTKDGYHWVCDQCFEDFKHQFKWTTKAPEDEK